MNTKNSLRLSDKWCDFLVSQGETGMGYQACTIKLADRREFKQTIVDSGYITRIKDVEGVPFVEDEIEEIIVTHEKWDWR